MLRVIRLLYSAGRTLSLGAYTDSRYMRPRRGEQMADLWRVTGDLRPIAADLRRVADRELAAYHERRSAH